MNSHHAVMGIFPNAKGFGYAHFDEQGNILDYGCPQCPNNTKRLERIRAILEFQRPQIIVLRDESAKSFKGSERTAALLADIRRIAQDLEMSVFNYSQYDVKQAFTKFGAQTKVQIAKEIGDWIPVLKKHLPKENYGDGQHYRASLFDAVALVYTYHHFIS